MARVKLKWGLFAGLLGFCALLLATLWVFQTLLLNDMYKWIRTREIAQAVQEVAASIAQDRLQETLHTLELSKEILVMPSQEFSAPKTKTEGERARRQPESITQTHSFPLPDGGSLSLTFHAIITPVDATLSVLHMQLLIITLIMLLLAIALAALLSSRIARPLELMNEGAKQLGSGDYSVSFSGEGFLELAELSNTLNHAALELSKTEALRRELLANISHDLRTPLALIYSHAELMHDFPEEITTQQTQVIMDETKRLSSLVTDVLDLSRLESGAIELQRVDFNLTQSVAESVTRMASLLAADGYTLDFHYRDSLCVSADPVKITQVLYNLLLNAVHYGGDARRVLLRQQLEGDFVRIEVVDSGPGIAAEDLPYIWDRYYKVDKTHKRSLTGTGLGLSIVKNIMDLHGGLCGVYAEPGAGSCFWFSLRIL